LETTIILRIEGCDEHEEFLVNWLEIQYLTKDLSKLLPYTIPQGPNQLKDLKNEASILPPKRYGMLYLIWRSYQGRVMILRRSWLSNSGTIGNWR
jgi:hypothetical protein